MKDLRLRTTRRAKWLAHMAATVPAIVMALALTGGAMAQDFDLGGLGNPQGVKGKPGAQLEPRLKRIWDRNWKVYAVHYAKLDDAFIGIAKYNTKHPSSAGITTEEAYRKLAPLVGGLGAPVKREMAKMEAQAAAATLPGLSVGDWGYVHSGTIADIIDDDTVLLSSLWLIDAQEMSRRQDEDQDRVFRLAGYRISYQAAQDLYVVRESLGDKQLERHFRSGVILRGVDTKKLVNGARWRGSDDKGLKLVVVSTSEHEGARMPVAVLASTVEKGITEKEFAQVLEEAKMPAAEFTQMVLSELVNDRDNAEQKVFEAIEKRRAAELARREAEKRAAEAKTAEEE